MVLNKLHTVKFELSAESGEVEVGKVQFGLLAFRQDPIGDRDRRQPDALFRDKRQHPTHFYQISNFRNSIFLEGSGIF